MPGDAVAIDEVPARQGSIVGTGVVVPMLIVTEVFWLALLGYAAIRLLL